MRLTPAELPTQTEYGMTIVPSMAELETKAGWTMSTAAMVERDKAVDAVKDIMTGDDNRWLEMIGVCAVQTFVNDEGVYDAVAYQGALREAFAGQNTDHLYVLNRGGIRKPRTAGGPAGILATDPIEARYLITELANNGADHAQMPFALATELADPGDYELASRFALLWSGARHDRMTTLRHIASAPVLEQASAQALHMLEQPGADIQAVLEVVKSNPTLKELFTQLANSNDTEQQIIANMGYALTEYSRRPFLFKTGMEGTLETALIGCRTAAEPQTNTFTGKDGRAYHTTTLGNPYTSILFRGGNRATPQALRDDLRRIDKEVAASGLLTGWFVDRSHQTAKQAARGVRTEEGQLAANDIIREEVAAGNLPNLRGAMTESNIYPGLNVEGQWGVSKVDPCVTAGQAAHMALELAGVRRS